MGLEAVEVVMGLEEAFALEIPDEVAARLLTPRQVAEYVAARLPVVPSDGCATQRTFYALRRGLRYVGVQGDLRPDTPMDTLLGREGWRVTWTRVRVRAGGPDWPAEPPPWPGRFRTGPATLGELARYVARHPARTGGPWTRERIELVIRHVVADVTGIEAFSMDDEFVRDMKFT